MTRRRIASRRSRGPAVISRPRKQVLLHRQLGDQAEFLKHRADAHQPRAMGREMRDLTPLKAELPAILREGAGHDIDER